MLFQKKDDKDAETFWNEKEEALGTPVLGRTLGRVVVERNSAPLWGLFYTTQNAIYFQTFKSDNWISMLFTQGRGAGRTKDETLEVPRDALKNFELHQRKGALFGLFKQPAQVEVTWASAETGKDETLLFEMEGDAKVFVESFPVE